MSDFRLNLPTDIPWERVCVTQDMIEPDSCPRRLPAKWQSSIAVYKYAPKEEFQIYPKYNITYLKVTATISGYQPLDKEVQGKVDFSKLSVKELPGFMDLLNAYLPCTGAILQVIVTPKENTVPPIPLNDYPFFLDFEPKSRELYQMATDSNELQSRSINSLNVTKSGGASQSMEVLDIDSGGSSSGGGGITVFGTGGSFNSGNSIQGQWGTKQLNAQESMSTRSIDVGQERRETFSHTTQISQMYHLLSSYHSGTNRAVFFIEPRPHTLEEPSGFVKGPREIEGIQEFFLIVAQLKEQNDFCVSVRLDTSHLTTTPILTYDTKTEFTERVTANAQAALRTDPFEGTQEYGTCNGDVELYDCHVKKDLQTTTYTAPTGYVIQDYAELINSVSTQGGKITYNQTSPSSLMVSAEATGHCCYATYFCDNSGWTLPDNPYMWQRYDGHADSQVQVNLISTAATKYNGDQLTLLITTRELCCCGGTVRLHPSESLVGVKTIPKAYNIDTSLMMADKMQAKHESASPCKCQEGATNEQAGGMGNKASRWTMRQVNELSKYIRSETIKNLNDPTAKPQNFFDSEFFIKQLEYRFRLSWSGRKTLEKPIMEQMPVEHLGKLKKHFRKPPEQITLYELLSLKNADLSKLLGIAEDEAHKLKLITMGVKFREEDSKYKKQPPKKK